MKANTRNRNSKKLQVSNQKQKEENGYCGYNIVWFHKSKLTSRNKTLYFFARMSGIVTRICAIVLPMLFVFIGTLKLYPVIPDVFHEMRGKFNVYRTSCPTVLFGFTPEGDTYRIFVGVWEVCAGLGALFGPLDVRRMACFALTVIMGYAVFTHVIFNEVNQIFVPGMFGLMWLFLFFHYNRKMKVHTD